MGAKDPGGNVRPWPRADSLWACLKETRNRLVQNAFLTIQTEPITMNHPNWTDGWFMLARAYLRASTTKQDSMRARDQIEAFAAEHSLKIVGDYFEHESGAKLARAELFRLLSDSKPGDVLLTERADRLSRLTDADWKKLRASLDAKEVRVVALDLPTSWMLTSNDEFTRRMFAAVNGMMLDVLAAVARKDYEDRRRRQAEGQAKAKLKGLYRGRKEDVKRNAGKTPRSGKAGSRA